MIIRTVQLKDNLVLAKIIRAAFIELDAPKTGTVFSDPTTDDLFSLFKELPEATLFVAEENEKVLGCCGVYPTEGLPPAHLELVKFYLEKSARGKGIGKILFEKSIYRAKELGASHLYIESQPKFNTAVGMYEKYGFTYLKEALGNSGHDNCDVWMLKDLK